MVLLCSLCSLCSLFSLLSCLSSLVSLVSLCLSSLLSPPPPPTLLSSLTFFFLLRIRRADYGTLWYFPLFYFCSCEPPIETRHPFCCLPSFLWVEGGLVPRPVWDPQREWAPVLGIWLRCKGDTCQGCLTGTAVGTAAAELAPVRRFWLRCKCLDACKPRESHYHRTWHP